MKRHRVVAALVLLALVTAGTVWWWLERDGNGEGPLTLYGNVEIRTAHLAFDSQGIVEEMFVDEGANVEAGDVLAKLDATTTRAELAEAKAQSEAQAALKRKLESGTRKQEIEQARARLASAAARVTNAEKVLDRLTESSASGAVSEKRLDDARAELEIERSAKLEAAKALELALEGPREEEIAEARARAEAAKARVQILEERLANTTLVAPTAGVIQNRLLELGEYANPTRAAYTLALTDPKWIRTYVPEPELGRVAPGARARIITDTSPGRDFEGRVGFISPVAEFTPKMVETTELRTKLVFEVRVLVDDPKDELRLGMPATVLIDDAASERTRSHGN